MIGEAFSAALKEQGIPHTLNVLPNTGHNLGDMSQKYHREIVLMLDDWRLTRTGAIDENFGHMHDRSHAGRIGNWVTVNAVSEFKKRFGRNSRLRLRLVNAANARIFVVGLQGMTGWTVALDGMPLEQPV